MIGGLPRGNGQKRVKYETKKHTKKRKQEGVIKNKESSYKPELPKIEKGIIFEPLKPGSEKPSHSNKTRETHIEKENRIKGIFS